MSGGKTGSLDEAAEAKQEAELQASLTRVNEVYHQLVETRRTILRMLQPLHAPAADPELVYSAFAQAAQKAVADLKEFQAGIRDPKMQELFKKSKEAIKEMSSTNGVEGWIAGLNGVQDDWMVNEAAGAAVDGIDALKIERETPKKS